MRIGVICEGPTDFLTIRSFLEVEFSKISMPTTFRIIQPALDNTLPGGWSQVLYWLENNPLEQRRAIYFKEDALFLNENNNDKFDALMFQLDTDIIGEQGFENFISERGIALDKPTLSSARGAYVRNVLRTIAGHADDDAEFAAKELSLAIVESCETWIIATSAEVRDPESLCGQDLINCFGKIFAEYNGNPGKMTYTKINKKVTSREKFCESLSKKSTPLGRAPHYDRIFDQIKVLQLGISSQ